MSQSSKATPTASNNPTNSGGSNASDGIVSGDQNPDRDDLIDVNYLDDPDGDRVDNNDAILGPNPGSNDDLIKAGDGNDTIFAGEGNDDAYGQDGDDLIYGGNGTDVLRGNDGNDTLQGDAGLNFLEGGAGDDVFIAGEGADSFFGNVGTDIIDYSGSTGAVNVNLDTNDLSGGAAGNDSINDGIEGVIGSDFDDTLVGGDGANIFDGGAGNDQITTGVGDTVQGGAGDDVFTIAAAQLAPGGVIDVTGGETGEVDGDTLDLRGLVSDPDTQISYTNNDPGAGGGLTGTATLDDGTIVNFTEIENILGGGPNPPPGPDGIVSGTDGDDTINLGYTGDPDGDRIDNNDAILGPNPNSNDDIVEAGDGDDIVRALDGNDSVEGGAGDDLLDGGVGNDTLNDESGSDTAIGGAGDDLIDVSGPDPALDDPLTVIPGVLEPDAFPNDDRDSVEGGEGNDTIITGDDRDTISGGDGDDSIEPGIDDDLVDAGDGNDTVYDLQGADTVFGGGGDDLIEVGVDVLSDYVGDDPNNRPGESDPNQEDGRDFVDGGSGNDTIRTGDDRDTIIGGSGNDSINAGIDDDEVTGGTGDDFIIGSHGSDTINAGAGNDTVYGGFGPEPIAGFAGEETDDTDPVPGNGRDLIDGGRGDDVIFGEDDDDTLIGGAGNDELDGGVDNDSITGGSGMDTIRGGQGNDFVNAGADDDTVDGGDGDDTLLGGGGDDLIAGGAGNDEISGGAGNDRIEAEDGDDTVVGGFGDDTVFGFQGDDSIVGGAGDDELSGGDGDDTIEGNDGEDTISGGSGNDSLTGADDADTFTDLNGGDFVSGGAGFGPTSSDFDTLDLTGSIPATPGAVRFELQDTVTDSDGNGLDGSVVYFDGSDSEVGRIDFENIELIVPCFTPGSLIATPKGERPVESLEAGDRVITRDNGIQEIAWVGHKALDARELHASPHMQPVLIKAGALGHGLPERDMLVSPNHRVLVANDQTALYFEEREVLVAAKHLVDNKGIVAVEATATTYIHFMFQQHEVVLSDGAWTESFQPGDYTLKGIGSAQRAEIMEIFPELEQAEGLQSYGAARRTLKKHEARLLIR